MSGGGGANPTGSLFPAQAVGGLFNQANSAFQPVPFPNTNQAASNAFGQIGGGFSPGAGTWNPTDQGSVGTQALGTGQGFLGSANEFLGPTAQYMNQTMQAGFDPQKKLFDQQFNQQQQQNLASEAAAGVANTPYGAGLTEQGNQNFDIAWQNAQLGRQGQGAQNAAALAGIPGQYATAGGNLLGTGANLGQGAAGFANNINQQQIQDYLSYLGASGGNAANYLNALNQSLNAGTNLFGSSATANQNFANAQAQALGGLGKLGGEAFGAAAPSLFAA